MSADVLNLRPTMTTSTTGETLQTDLDGWPFRADTPIGPWRVTPCCGAFAEYDSTGTGTDGLLICKHCYEALPDGYVDGPARLSPTDPAPVQVAYRVDLTTQPKEAAAMTTTDTDLPAEGLADGSDRPHDDPPSEDPAQTEPVIPEGRQANEAGQVLCVGGCGLPAQVAERTGRGVKKGDPLKYAEGHRKPEACTAARDAHLARLVETGLAERAQGFMLGEIKGRMDAPPALVAEAMAKIEEAEGTEKPEASVTKRAAENGGKVGGRKRPPAKGGAKKPAKSTSGKKGAKKITDDEVRALRILRKRDEKAWTYRALGDLVGADDQTAWLIIKGRSRADVPDDGPAPLADTATPPVKAGKR